MADDASQLFGGGGADDDPFSSLGSAPTPARPAVGTKPVNVLQQQLERKLSVQTASSGRNGSLASAASIGQVGAAPAQQVPQQQQQQYSVAHPSAALQAVPAAEQQYPSYQQPLTQERISAMYYYVPEGYTRTAEFDSNLYAHGYVWMDEYGCYAHWDTYCAYMAQHAAQQSQQVPHASYAADSYQQAADPAASWTHASTAADSAYWVRARLVALCCAAPR